MSNKFMFFQTNNIFTFNRYSKRLMQHVHSQLLYSYTVFVFYRLNLVAKIYIAMLYLKSSDKTFIKHH